jgi:NitT/TauT family transport system ATP-binding protein
MSQSIELRNVSKSFGEFQALSNVNLHIEEGEFVALVGKSGCGKSTLLRIIAGLLQPSQGSVMVAGQPVTGPSDDVGIAFQSSVLLPWRTVEGNIRLQLEIRGIDRPDTDREVKRLIELTGLKGFEKNRPYELSGGMQQRVSLCRALVHNPSLLLMDEPFGALDAMTREQLNAEIQRVWMETGKTIVLVTHSIIEAVYLADRVVVMDSRPGRITEIVDVKVERPRSFSKLGAPAFQAASDRIRELMDAAGMTA